jgi:phage gp36-like protein
MSYCTYDDLLLNFGEQELEQVADRDRDGSADDGVLNEGIAFATDLIDGYLRNRYTLPLTTVPRSLTGVACDIARYRFYQDQPTDLVVLRYNAAIQWLRDIADGRVGLDVATTQSESAQITYSQPSAIFTELVW